MYLVYLGKVEFLGAWLFEKRVEPFPLSVVIDSLAVELSPPVPEQQLRILTYRMDIRANFASVRVETLNPKTPKP